MSIVYRYNGLEIEDYLEPQWTITAAVLLLLLL